MGHYLHTSHPVSGTPHPILLPSKGRRNRNAVVRLPFDLLRHGYFQNLVHFSFLEIFQFPSKCAVLRPVALTFTPIIPNIYGVIMIFKGIFRADPLPTPIFCRNMA